MIDATRCSDETWDALLALRHGETASADARLGNPAAAPYLPVARRDGRSMVIAQVGQSLDGRVATVDGDARDLSGEDGFAHLHRLRALVDAVVVGVGCVVADNPRLTVRNVTGENPVRIAIDPNGRIPANCWMLDGQVPTIVVQADGIEARRDVETISLPRNACGLLEPAAILHALHARGMTNILIEGGAKTIENFLCRGLVDRLHICIAPLIMGSGSPGLCLPPIRTLSQALRPRVTTYDLGSDVLFDCEFLKNEQLEELRPVRQAQSAADTSQALMAVK